MTRLIIFLVVVVAIQVAIYLYTRKLKQKNKQHVLTRYNISTPKEAWVLLQDPDLPEEDRQKIQEYYNAKH